MPLCRSLIRSLLHSRASHSVRARPPYRSASAGLRSTSTATRQPQQQNGNIAPGNSDAYDISADSSYLDFILGPREDVPAPHNDTARESVAEKEVKRTTWKSRSLPARATRASAHLDSSKFRKSLSSQKGTEEDRRTRVKARRIPQRLKGHTATSRAALEANLNFHRLRGQGVSLQSKFISVRFGASRRGVFSRHWNINYARIQGAFDRPDLRGDSAKQIAPNLPAQTEEWVKVVVDYLDHGSKPVRIGQLLHQYPKHAISRWGSVALWFLYHEPERMLDFLRVSNTDPCPPLSWVEDSLQYLAKYFSHSSAIKHMTAWQKLHQIFLETAKERSDERLWIQSSFCRLLIQHCTDKQIQEMYRTIKLRKVKVSWHTYLHFATYFAKHEHFEQSLDAILEARDAGIPLDSYAFRSNCATLLRTAIRQPGGLRVTMRIVSNLVEVGLPLNARLCNIVMLNAVEAGDLKTAFSVYHSLVGHGLKADAYTYTILLRGCRANIDDAESLNTTIRNAVEGGHVTGNIVLATGILHCLALHHTKHNPENAYDTVMDAYAQLFDLHPLQKMGLPLPRFSLPTKPANERLQPNEYVMNIVLATYLDHYFIQARPTSPIYELYQRIRALTEAGEEPFNLLAKTDYTANVFLKSFTRTKKGLLHAAQVIKDMQRSLPVSARVDQCAPTVQSWSIFLHGFTRHKQVQLAEQVLNFMRAQGLKPNHVTWTSLIAGYASAQDLDRVLDSVRKGEVDGAIWDEWTMSGLKKLADQRRLHMELQKRRLAASLDFTQELRDGLGTRLSAVPIDHEANSDVEQNK